MRQKNKDLNDELQSLSQDSSLTTLQSDFNDMVEQTDIMRLENERLLSKIEELQHIDSNYTNLREKVN